ncbi:zinc finger BED domain-containing protein 1-like [Huso huso]|uniref:Zinc finger BED domain-containing protein 1-like n=1 Tax=Huso huso TaxID=61971 RepID=A0ABR1A0T6_HUSHU
MLYPMASVLDPTFGFLWLEADHPGNDQTKSKIREEIIDEIVNQVDLMCPREIAGPSEQQAPASKVPKGTLFSTYEQRRQTVATASPLLTRNIVQRYLDDISSQTQGTSSGTDRWGSVQETNVYKRMLPLLEKIFCIPATSAPVERVFSQSGLLMHHTEQEWETSFSHSWCF